jgi:peptide/nickel transport system substrate-binding protein
MFRKYVYLFIAALFMLGTLDTHSEIAAQSGGTYRSVFRTGCMQGPLWTTCGHRLDMTVLQPLVAIRWTADSIQPMLAERWEMEGNGEAYVLHLREGVKWHDGAPFTADDVIFSLNAYANPQIASAWASKLQDVAGYADFRDGKATSLSGVTKVDEKTVRVALASPSPLWVDLQLIFVVMMPNHILGEVPADQLRGHPFWENRVGTGPFKWSQYVPDQFIEVVRNEDYYEGAPRLDRIIYQIYADIPTILNALSNGEVDDMSYEGGGIPETEVGRFLNQPNLTVLPQLNAGLPTYIQWDLSKQPFDDVRFRQAVLYAIDRDAIIESIYLGLYTRADTQFPQAWARPEGLNAYPFNPDRARELLAEMGWTPNSQPFDFIYYYTDNVTAEAMVAIQAYLADVGINIAPRLLDPAGIQAVYADKAFEMGFFANGQGLDPSLGRVLTTCGAQLALGYCNERVDELHQLGVSVADRDERAVYYHEISRILNEDLQKGYLWYAARPLAFNNRVVGLAQHWLEQPLVLFNLPVYQEIHTWYIGE